MLEPLATIGLVSNIVQFVDFSNKILSKTKKFYRSADGTLEENNNAELAAKRLVELSTALQTTAGFSNGDETLQKICKECNEMAEELLKALEELKVNGTNSKWKSVRKALKSVCRKEEIDGIQNRLASFREEMNLHIVVDLRYAILCITYITRSGSTDEI